jgi:hypothetical protein
MKEIECQNSNKIKDYNDPIQCPIQYFTYIFEIHWFPFTPKEVIIPLIVLFCSNFGRICIFFEHSDVQIAEIVEQQ